MADTKDQSHFWHSFIKALDAVPGKSGTIRGRSGIDHPVVAAGLDEQRRRLVIISGEHDSRSAAMSQVDIQASLPDLRVVVARPIAVNLSQAAQILVGISGGPLLNLGDFLSSLEKTTSKSEIGNLAMKYLERGFKAAPVSVLPQIFNILQQLSNLKFVQQEFKEAMLADSTKAPPILNLEALLAQNPAEADRRVGICPIPLYDFSQDTAELFKSGTDESKIRETLLGMGLLQYFFPPPDQLALALVDKGEKDPKAITTRLADAPLLGHPLGAPELLAGNVPVTKLVDQLTERNLVVSGQFGIELTPQGRSIRASVEFKPRESLITKLMNMAKVDLKDFVSFFVSPKK